MTDESWDNGGQGVPVKAGMPRWAKITLGCGVAFLVVLVTSVSGVAIFANRFKKDPQGFERAALGMVVDKVRPDWEDLRAVVEALRTPEGCQRLYAANPSLTKRWPNESAFLEAASQWQKDLAPAPELTPELIEKGGVQINPHFGGSVRVHWTPKSGRSVFLTFGKPHKPGDKVPRPILELEVVTVDSQDLHSTSNGKI